MATNEQFICSFAYCTDIEEMQSTALHRLVTRNAHAPFFTPGLWSSFVGLCAIYFFKRVPGDDGS